MYDSDDSDDGPTSPTGPPFDVESVPSDVWSDIWSYLQAHIFDLYHVSITCSAWRAYSHADHRLWSMPTIYLLARGYGKLDGTEDPDEVKNAFRHLNHRARVAVGLLEMSLWRAGPSCKKSLYIWINHPVELALAREVATQIRHHATSIERLSVFWPNADALHELADGLPEMPMLRVLRLRAEDETTLPLLSSLELWDIAPALEELALVPFVPDIEFDVDPLDPPPVLAHLHTLSFRAETLDEFAEYVELFGHEGLRAMKVQWRGLGDDIDAFDVNSHDPEDTELVRRAFSGLDRLEIVLQCAIYPYLRPALLATPRPKYLSIGMHAEMADGMQFFAEDVWMAVQDAFADLSHGPITLAFDFQEAAWDDAFAVRDNWRAVVLTIHEPTTGRTRVVKFGRQASWSLELWKTLGPTLDKRRITHLTVQWEILYLFKAEHLQTVETLTLLMHSGISYSFPHHEEWVPLPSLRHLVIKGMDHLWPDRSTFLEAVRMLVPPTRKLMSLSLHEINTGYWKEDVRVRDLAERVYGLSSKDVFTDEDGPRYCNCCGRYGWVDLGVL